MPDRGRRRRGSGQEWNGAGTVHFRPVVHQPWRHIEAGMGFQLGLPVLVFRESGGVADGVLEQGVMAAYMPEIQLDADADLNGFFQWPQWKPLIGRFEAEVREVRRVKGIPSLLRAKAGQADSPSGPVGRVGSSAALAARFLRLDGPFSPCRSIPTVRNR